MAKTFTAKIKIKGLAPPQEVTVQTINISQAKKLIEAQYKGSMERWVQRPREVR